MLHPAAIELGVRLVIRLVALALLLVFSTLVRAQHAHEHGIARMEVAVDGSMLSITLESPLDNLVGFEHGPRTEKQRTALAKMTAELNSERLFTLPAAAECKLARAESTHPYQVGQPGDKAGKGDKSGGDVHAELQSTWEFACAKPESLDRVGVQLFDVFRGIKRIKAQVVTAKGQSAAALTSARRTLTL